MSGREFLLSTGMVALEQVFISKSSEICLFQELQTNNSHPYVYGP